MINKLVVAILLLVSLNSGAEIYVEFQSAIQHRERTVALALNSPDYYKIQEDTYSFWHKYNAEILFEEISSTIYTGKAPDSSAYLSGVQTMTTETVVYKNFTGYRKLNVGGVHSNVSLDYRFCYGTVHSKPQWFGTMEERTGNIYERILINTQVSVLFENRSKLNRKIDVYVQASPFRDFTPHYFTDGQILKLDGFSLGPYYSIVRSYPGNSSNRDLMNYSPIYSYQGLYCKYYTD